MDENKKVTELSEQTMEWYFHENPFMATLLGRHEYDHLVPDYSRPVLIRQVERAKEICEQLERLDYENLDVNGKIDYRILKSLLQQSIRSVEVIKSYEKEPGNIPGIIMTTAFLMLTREYAPLVSRARNLIKRLKEVPRLLEQQRDLVNNPPRVFTEIAIQQTEGGLKFFETVKNMVKEKAGMLAPLFTGVVDETIKAFNAHLQWLQDLMHESKGDFAVGADLFTEMLQKDHFMEYTAESLLAKGWELFKETEDQIKEVAYRIDPERKPEEILAELKSEHPSAEELLPFYRRELARAKEFVQKEGVVDIPPGEELIIEETPVFQRSLIPYAAYMPPAPFEKEKLGRFWVTPVDPASPAEIQVQKLQGHSRFKIPVTTVHEGYPGHHLQLVWSNNALSMIRKLAHSTLFIEGWAFYCEELMEELGFLDEPKVKLARLKDQLWRAARIIIDASLHSRKMSVEEANIFLTEKVGLERVNAEAEVKRYTTSPTQPMSYLMGKLEIISLVEEYRRHKGDFNLKKFHNTILAHGSIPPALMREVLFHQ